MLGAYFLGENFVGDDQPEPAAVTSVQADQTALILLVTHRL